MIRRHVLFALALSLTFSIGLRFTPSAIGQPADRPNILWITSEDNSASWLGCYGNALAKTPRIDRLAAEGVQYRNAFSNAPVCAVARSTLFTGVYATTLGTQHMRSRHAIPDRFRPYVSYLRESGYYCTNNWKTDYNFLGEDESWWDDSSETAHYRNRPEGAPFFAVLNFTTSHESSLFTEKTAQYRQSGLIPPAPRLDLDQVEVPPIYPDTPVVRRDIAVYHDVITAMDQQVGLALDELEAAGLANDTIVFYYSDHGGVLPRSKRFVYHTGVHVPLIFRIPPKFANDATPPGGSQIDSLVEFVDLAPTALALAGITPPEHMQGRPLLAGEGAQPRRYAFLYGDRFDETLRMHRALTDGEYRYVHNFYPHLPGTLQNEYPYGIATWRVMRAMAKRGELYATLAPFWKAPQRTAELFRVAVDPWETVDLIIDNKAPKRDRDRAAAMRSVLRARMLETRDLGVIPEAFWGELAAGQTIYDYANNGDFPWEEAIDLAFAASDQAPSKLGRLKQGLEDEHPVLRYWGAMGCLELGGAAAPASNSLKRLLEDPHAANRITAAHALYRIEPSQSRLNTLADEAIHARDDASATLAFHTLYQLDATSRVSTHDLRTIAQASPTGYAAVWANRLLAERPRRSTTDRSATHR
ncbi:Sulfatase [Pirellulimonas nuda]|uniref:Sulfatase n=1 Tax=Pirellulimonas nuda TaxID=2528009 RepID=A0A518DAR2_9BACT|nr:sulfatase [Pirellulimonas nuda]QDU88570.1 Sulfatase [Pirellulimonas nuda]